MKEKVIPILNDEYKVIVCFGNPKQVEKILKSWGHKAEDTKSSLLGNRGVCFYSEGKQPVITFLQSHNSFLLQLVLLLD